MVATAEVRVIFWRVVQLCLSCARFFVGICTMDLVRFVQRHALSVAVITVILTMTLGGTLAYVWMLRRYNQKYATGFVRVPVEILSALIVVVLIITMLQQSLHAQNQREQALRNDLSNFTQRVIVDRWEGDAKSTPALAAMYDDVHLNYLSPSDAVIRARLRKANVPYVTKADNPEAWHFAAQYIQEMVNVVRKFEMEERFVVNDQAARARINKTAYAGWFQCFRTYMATPVVRNVWERYKYRHANPAFSAWVYFYIIDPCADGTCWSAHRKEWDASTRRVLRSDPGDTAEVVAGLYQ